MGKAAWSREEQAGAGTRGRVPCVDWPGRDFGVQGPCSDVERGRPICLAMLKQRERPIGLLVGKWPVRARPGAWGLAGWCLWAWEAWACTRPFLGPELVDLVGPKCGLFWARPAKWVIIGLQFGLGP